MWRSSRFEYSARLVKVKARQKVECHEFKSIHFCLECFLFLVVFVVAFVYKAAEKMCKVTSEVESAKCLRGTWSDWRLSTSWGRPKTSGRSPLVIWLSHFSFILHICCFRSRRRIVTGAAKSNMKDEIRRRLRINFFVFETSESEKIFHLFSNICFIVLRSFDTLFTRSI